MFFFFLFRFVAAAVPGVSSYSLPFISFMNYYCYYHFYLCVHCIIYFLFLLFSGCWTTSPLLVTTMGCGSSSFFLILN